MKEYRNPLRRSIFLGCGLFIVLLCLTLGILGFIIYYRGMIDKYHAYIGDALNLTLTEIDGEDLKACLESGEKSEKFRQTQDFLNRVKDNYAFEFIYVIKPLNLNETDNVMNIMAGVTKAELEEYGENATVELGSLTGDSYSAEVARYYLDQMDSREHISFFRNRTDDFGYMYTGLVSVPDASGNSAAILAADLNMDEIMQMLFNYILILVAEMTILSVVFLSGIYQWMNRRIIRPMTRLERAANGFVKRSHGQEDPEALVLENPDIHTGDELESLSDTIVTMSRDMTDFMKNLLKASLEKERLGAELSVATEIQDNMLPNTFPAFPGRKEFDIYAYVTPSKEVAGDFYDFFLVDDDHLALVVADVSDKGIPAGLMMVVAKTIIKNQALAGKPPAEIMRETNRQLYENNGGDMFVKAWFGILELSSGVFRSVNAGHVSPAYRPAHGSFSIMREKKNVALALMPDTRYEENAITMRPGDDLFVYTDGVIEATDATDAYFGEGRMLEALNEDASGRPIQLVRVVRKRVGGYVKDTPQDDDMTMLSLAYFGPHGAETRLS